MKKIMMMIGAFAFGSMDAVHARAWWSGDDAPFIKAAPGRMALAGGGLGLLVGVLLKHKEVRDRWNVWDEAKKAYRRARLAGDDATQLLDAQNAARNAFFRSVGKILVATGLGAGVGYFGQQARQSGEVELKPVITADDLNTAIATAWEHDDSAVCDVLAIALQPNVTSDEVLKCSALESALNAKVSGEETRREVLASYLLWRAEDEKGNYALIEKAVSTGLFSYENSPDLFNQLMGCMDSFIGSYPKLAKAVADQKPQELNHDVADWLAGDRQAFAYVMAATMNGQFDDVMRLLISTKKQASDSFALTPLNAFRHCVKSPADQAALLWSLEKGGRTVKKEYSEALVESVQAWFGSTGCTHAAVITAFKVNEKPQMLPLMKALVKLGYKPTIDDVAAVCRCANAELAEYLLSNKESRVELTPQNRSEIIGVLQCAAPHSLARFENVFVALANACDSSELADMRSIARLAMDYDFRSVAPKLSNESLGYVSVLMRDKDAFYKLHEDIRFLMVNRLFAYGSLSACKWVVDTLGKEAVECFLRGDYYYGPIKAKAILLGLNLNPVNNSKDD